MKFELQNKKLNQIKADFEVILVVRKNLKHKWVKDLVQLKNLNFKGEAEQTVYLAHRKRLYIAVESMAHDELRAATAKAIKILNKVKGKSLKIGSYSNNETEENIKAMAEGFILGIYSFDKYKSKKGSYPINRVVFSGEDYDGKTIDVVVVKQAIKRGEIIAEATNYTREIVNMTPADITPVSLADMAKKLAKESGLTCKVQGEEFLKKQQMGAFLAVSKASPYPPQLIHLIHKPAKAKVKIVLVGKGLTFDSGGLSLKPSEHMLTMKSDKSGASAILGIMQAVSRLELPLEVHGIIGATENVVGKHAYKPDDVLMAKNKKTIEVRNTDAEGRLVLADCLCYGQDLNPDHIVDLATLTGACIVALGEYTIGVMGYNDKLKYDILEAGNKSGELIAELPFNKYLKKLLKSEVADISNISSSRYGGAITAALFLSEFIEKKNKDKWVHLDIAGPAYSEKEWDYNPYGASGAGVRLIVKWLEELLD